MTKIQIVLILLTVAMVLVLAWRNYWLSKENQAKQREICRLTIRLYTCQLREDQEKLDSGQWWWGSM